MDSLVSGHHKDEGLRSAEIGYVLVWLRGESAGRISARMGRVSEVAIEHGGMTDCMVSGLVVVCFGTMPVPTSQQGDRSGLVVALIREFGEDIKLVHGSSRGHFGNLGSPRRMAYSFVLPEFELALARLCALRFGQAEEYGSISDSA